MRVFNNPSYMTMTIMINIACMFSIYVKSLVFGLWKNGIIVWMLAMAGFNIFFELEVLFDFFT